VTLVSLMSECPPSNEGYSTSSVLFLMSHLPFSNESIPLLFNRLGTSMSETELPVSELGMDKVTIFRCLRPNERVEKHKQ
jgi:hypothetical protein